MKVSFKNERIQNLHNYLAEDFCENDLVYTENSVMEKFASFIFCLTEEDWEYFERTIEKWNSENLERLARLIIDLQWRPKKISPYIAEKVYCLAFIHCDYQEIHDSLLDDFDIGFFPKDSTDVELLKKLYQRVEEILATFKFYEMNPEIEKAENLLKMVEERLNAIKRR